MKTASMIAARSGLKAASATKATAMSTNLRIYVADPINAKSA
jgi:hypothetical protein